MAPIDKAGNITQTKAEEVKTEDTKKEGNPFEFTQEDYDNLAKAYEDFLNQEFDPLWDNYYINADYLVVRVFTFNPVEHRENAPKIDLTMGQSNHDLKLMCFPIGMVYRGGSKAIWTDDEGKEHRYKQGDVVKMKDDDARVIANPDYEGWTRNEMEKSNMKKVGEAPPQKISYLRSKFGKFMTKSNPFDLFVTRDDLFTFDLPVMYVEGKVKDPKAFLA